MTNKVGQKSFESLIHARPSEAAPSRRARSKWVDLAKPAKTSSYAEVPVKSKPEGSPFARKLHALWRNKS